jgi:hypothetical protein
MPRMRPIIGSEGASKGPKVLVPQKLKNPNNEPHAAADRQEAPRHEGVLRDAHGLRKGEEGYVDNCASCKLVLLAPPALALRISNVR